MKRTLGILFSALTIAILSGCGPDSSEKINTDFINSETNNDLNQCKTDLNEKIIQLDTLNNNLLQCKEDLKNAADGSFNDFFSSLADRTDINNIKINHYVNGELFESNEDQLFGIQDDKVVVQNEWKFPVYDGTPMRHVIIVEFYQIK